MSKVNKYKLGETVWEFEWEATGLRYFTCPEIHHDLELTGLDLLKMGATPITDDETEFLEIKDLGCLADTRALMEISHAINDLNTNQKLLIERDKQREKEMKDLTSRLVEIDTAKKLIKQLEDK